MRIDMTEQQAESTIIELLLKNRNGEIKEKVFIDKIEELKLDSYYNSSTNENIINIITATFSSGLPASSSLLEYYLAKGIKPDLSNKWKNRTPLFYCNYDLSKVKLLLKYGANINHLDDGGSTFIMYGTTFDVFDLAIQNGYNTDFINSAGYNLLFTLFAHKYNYGKESEKERIKILKYLLENPIFNVNDFIEEKNILQFAFTSGEISFEALQLLIDYGADPKIKTRKELSFQLWSDDVELEIGLDIIDILEFQLKTLIEENNNGYISEEQYFEKGQNYFTEALKIVKMGRTIKK